MVGKMVQKHPFFKTIDWVKLFNKEVGVPFKPALVGIHLMLEQVHFFAYNCPFVDR